MNHPTYEHLVKWQNQTLFTVYLDEKKVSNNSILEYHPDDLPYFKVKKLEKGKYRIDLWTSPFWQNKKNIHSYLNENYGTQFTNGAQKNGKKSLVIEIKNDQIWINGKFTPISNLKAAINNITKRWSPKEYAEAVRSFIFKGNSVAFSKKAEKEFQKTNYAKANPSAKLLPPPPPPPPASPVSPLPIENNRSPIQEQKNKVSAGDSITITINDTGEKHTLFIASSPAEVKRYNQWAKEANTQKNKIIKLKVVKEMRKIYNAMSLQDKSTAQPFPTPPPVPPRGYKRLN